MSVYCDKCGVDITLKPSQSICLGRGKSYDLCFRCYDSISEKLSEVDKVIFGEDDDAHLPERCIDCPNFLEFPVAKITNDMAAAYGSCEKVMKNCIDFDPCNQTPSWCPLKGEPKGDKEC